VSPDRHALLRPLSEMPSHPPASSDPLWLRWPLLRWMLIALLLLLPLALTGLLSGCGTTPSPPMQRAPEPPAQFRAPCPPPPTLQQGTAQEVLSAWVEAMRLYSRCEQTRADLLEWTRTQR
jgi:hypothetical protein